MMKRFRVIRGFLLFLVLLVGCEQNPLTGKMTMAFYSEKELFKMANEQYAEFLSEHPPITGTPEAKMVERVGKNIAAAAQKWLASKGSKNYLKNYQWEYNLVDSKEINAWCMPGGKIVVYTGILPITANEDGLAVVMGHEVAHALLSHGQQRLSAGLLQELGAKVVGEFTESDLVMAVYGLTTNLAGMLPFSRDHESEADRYGLILAAIAGYDPEEGPRFWKRMPGGDSIEFLSTHPNHSTRIDDLEGWVKEAEETAAKLAPKTNE